MPDITEKKLNSKLSDLEQSQQVDQSYLKLLDTRTRDYIATLAVRTFFLLLAVILIGIPFYNANVSADLRINLSDLLQQYSAILGPVLGFVIGYYFKTKD